jgi:hypothetical protein
MIKKVALIAAASVLSFGIAASTYAEEAAKEDLVRCVRALKAGEAAAGQVDGKDYVMETAAKCQEEGGEVK